MQIVRRRVSVRVMECLNQSIGSTSDLKKVIMPSRGFHWEEIEFQDQEAGAFVVDPVGIINYFTEVDNG